MNNLKNLLIAILTGLLVLTLSTQNSNGATVKTYDAVKLARYSACINGQMNWEIAIMQSNGGNGTLNTKENLMVKCIYYLP